MDTRQPIFTPLKDSLAPLFRGYGEKEKYRRKTKITTKEQDLADQIYQSFHKEIKFGRIIKIIKDKGFQATFENWKSSLQGKNPIALFLHLSSREHILWE